MNPIKGQMAIHDMQRQHYKRLSTSLKKDMDYAAKHYAKQVEKEVRRQDVYESWREREFKMAKWVILQKFENITSDSSEIREYY